MFFYIYYLVCNQNCDQHKKQEQNDPLSRDKTDSEFGPDIETNR